MPELPEVETVKRGLSERIIGLRVREVEVLCAKSFVGDRAAVVGKTVLGLRRFGKALVIDLSEGVSMLVHLRMTGQLIFDQAGNDANAGHALTSPSHTPTAHPTDANPTPVHRYAAGHPSENFVAQLPNKQTRVIFRFTAGQPDLAAGTLYFNDQRKFGFVKVLQTAAVTSEPFVAKLAQEPWAMGDAEFFAALQRRRNSAVKAALLDQSVVAGLGNIYADEALFTARIHPERRAGSLSRAEATALLAAAREVMERSIASGGSTMRTYVKADGTRGNYLEQFAQVFRKEGQPCPRCGAKIVKIRVAGRGTHICPNCQQRPDTATDTAPGTASSAKQARGEFRKTGVGKAKTGAAKARSATGKVSADEEEG